MSNYGSPSPMVAPIQLPSGWDNLVEHGEGTPEGYEYPEGYEPIPQHQGPIIPHLPNNFQIPRRNNTNDPTGVAPIPNNTSNDPTVVPSGGKRRRRYRKARKTRKVKKNQRRTRRR